ncbi:hypothetical protein Droror1_Dr00013717 [Drosera rotundifolia]
MISQFPCGRIYFDRSNPPDEYIIYPFHHRRFLLNLFSLFLFSSGHHSSVDALFFLESDGGFNQSTPKINQSPIFPQTLIVDSPSIRRKPPNQDPKIKGHISTVQTSLLMRPSR